MKLIKYDNSVSVKVVVPHLDNRIGKEHQLSPSCLNYTNNIVTYHVALKTCYFVIYHITPKCYNYLSAKAMVNNLDNRISERHQESPNDVFILRSHDL